ncbi:hypothetical protein D9M71_708300 [compost metagenome]
MQIGHLHVSFEVQAQDLVKRHCAAKRSVRGVPAINQDDAGSGLPGQYMSGNPGAAFSEALANLELKVLARASGKLVDQGHGLAPVRIILSFAKADHLVPVQP